MIFDGKKLNDHKKAKAIFGLVIILAALSFSFGADVKAEEKSAYEEFFGAGTEGAASTDELFGAGTEGTASEGAASTDELPIELSEFTAETGKTETETRGFFNKIIGQVVGWTGAFLISIEGGILWLEMKILLYVVQYNKFVDSSAVSMGWTLVRDVANMFFVVILLVIALATILRYESFHLKRFLPKLLLMAILVNFSKTIAALFIDAAQVVMMTFVAAFTVGGGEANLVTALRIKDIISYTTDVKSEHGLGIWEIVGTIFIIVIMLLITIIVLLVFIVVLVFRIIMLWLLIILSPLAYILAAWPGKRGQSYAQQWWDEFTKNVIIGPVLAFFLWLTFAIASGTSGTDSQLMTKDFKDATTDTSLTNSNTNQTISSGDVVKRLTTVMDEKNPPDISARNVMMTKPSSFLAFIVVIALLLGSLQITQQIGGAGGAFAGQMFGRIRGAGVKGALMPFKAATGALSWANRKMYSGEVPFIGKYTKGWNLNPALWYQGYKDYMGRRKSDQERAGQAAAGYKFLGATEERGAEGVVARTTGLARLALGSPGDFMRSYGRLKNIPRYVETATGRKIFKPKVARKPGESDADYNKRVEEERKFVPALPYYAAEAYRAVENEEMKKFPETMEYSEVHNGLVQALKDKDSLKFTTLLKKAAKDYNDNEFLNEFGYWSGAHGGGIGEGGKGMGAFIDEILVGKLEMPRQQALQVMTDIGYMNEDRGHGENSRTTVVEGGTYRPTTELEQASSHMNEFFKGNVRSKLQNSNRLETGREAYDPATGEKRYKIGLSGAMTFAGGASYIAQYMKRGEFNPSTLSKWQEDKGTLDFLKQAKDENGNSLMPSAYSKTLKKDISIVDLIQNPELAKEIEPVDFKSTTKVGGGDLKVFGQKVLDAKARWAGSRAPAPAAPTPTPRLAEKFDRERYLQTQKQVERYGETNFFESGEFRQNPAKYEKASDYQRHYAVFNQKELEKMRGVKTAVATRPGEEQAGVGLNFQNSEIQKTLGVNPNQDAVYYGGEDKKKAVEAVVKAYQQQLLVAKEAGENISDEDIAARVINLRKGLNAAKTLRVHNNASLSSRLDQARHERAHATTRGLTDEKVDEIWQTVDKSQQEAIMKDINSRYSGLTEQQKKKEALAEMVGVGKGAYQASDKTKKALAGAGIKTRGEEALERVSKIGAVMAAGGVKVEQGAEALTDALLSAADLPIRKAKEAVDKVTGFYDRIANGIQNTRERAAFGSYFAAAKKLTEAKINKKKVEEDAGLKISNYQQYKAGNVQRYKDAIQKRDQAVKEGRIKDASEYSAKANLYLDENRMLDKDIASLQKKISKAGIPVGRATDKVVRTRENYDQVRGVKPPPKVEKPEVKTAAQQVLRQIAQAPDAAAKTKAISQAEHFTAAQIADAGQGEVAGQGEKLKAAMKGFNSEAIVDALTGIENTLVAIQSTLEKLPGGQVDQGAKDSLAQLASQISSQRQNAESGKVIDDLIVRGLLTRMNDSLSTIKTKTGKDLGKMPDKLI